MGQIAFFRSGNEPIVLNEQQRNSRKEGNRYLQNSTVANTGAYNPSFSLHQAVDGRQKHEQSILTEHPKPGRRPAVVRQLRHRVRRGARQW